MKAEQDYSEGITSRVTQKQVDLVYRNQPFALFATFLVAILVLSFLYSSDIIYNLAVCFLLFTLVTLFRSYFNWSYIKANKNNTVDVDRTRKLYLLGIVFSGMVWGATTLLLFPVTDLNGQILLLIVVMGVAAAAHTTMGFLRTSIISFIILLTLPLLYAVYHSDLPGATAILVAIVVHSLFMLRSSLLFYDSTFNMLRLNEIAIQREHKLMLQTAKAKSANEEKSKFLSRMSHELRTPLNAILGMNELLLRDKKEPLTEKQRDRSQKVVEAGKHLLSIVDDVLDLSRIEAGNVDIDMRLTHCQAVIRGSIKLVEGKAAQRNITISNNTERPDVFVMADGKRLKQIIVNLLDNAVKYNKQGGQVSIILDADDNDVVRLSIIDTGYGIDESSTDKLFKPFSRLGADGLGIDGTGIGLSLSKQFIELMHGRIGVECRLGKGCCFWIELPYVEHTADIESKEVEDQNIVILNTGKHGKILLVEDNLVNCEVAVDMLEELGFNTDVVHDGKQAVEAVKANQYALILMDCEMPVMDGFAATKQIRNDEKLLQQKPTPIIALTAHAITGARDKCIANGMDDFLSKPFSLSSLQLTVSKWLLISPAATVKTFSSKKSQHVSQDDGNVLKGENGGAAVLDQIILNRLYNRKRKDGSSLVEKVVNIYLEQSPRLLAELTQATLRKDVEAVRGISHTLKSSSINVGATGLSALCEKVEQVCEQGYIESALVDKVHKTYTDVEQALNVVLQNIN
jgi:signal transduction histidine kinase/DNA-binding NarL/FixJ family response regulator/HPt (histidine-containing phosphotransfer) domain-containing protein